MRTDINIRSKQSERYTLEVVLQKFSAHPEHLREFEVHLEISKTQDRLRIETSLLQVFSNQILIWNIFEMRADINIRSKNPERYTLEVVLKIFPAHPEHLRQFEVHLEISKTQDRFRNPENWNLPFKEGGKNQWGR